ncbi:TRAP transporter substrate-binding protein [Nitratidesulfovibrio sp. HK-II]|uniref:TRAP transporter substrate-binding protein n=1 Tax=Nitratidesulfovibrio sp. HK-II TaxID=2009266 RepID=UPI000E2FACD9|nr:TRAP transporter substrate-binding protein [Nitratidesulfovibrio sp. HK-II]GBO97577.1 TRAP-type C4-dicarboxylate transport system [Nitratidesulfovibrio sp. HK-II]
MNRLLALLAALALMLSWSAASEATEYKPMTIMAATANPEGSLHVVGLTKFKEIIEKESGGAIAVKLFTGGSMGDEQSNVKQLRGGELHISALAAGNLTPFAPRATLVVLPYLFPKIEDAYALLGNDSFLSELGDAVAKQSKTRPLAWLVGGYRVLTNSKRPVTQMSDLQGLKIRVPAVPIQLESFRSWGVEPHPLAWSETFNALQQGVADGQENPHSINRDQKFWEVQKYITDLHYMLWVGPLLVSESWYSRLPAETKSLVDKAAREAARYEWTWAAEQDKAALKTCLERGMSIHKLSDEPAWMEKSRALWPQFHEAIGGKEQLDKALAIIANN